MVPRRAKGVWAGDAPAALGELARAFAIAIAFLLLGTWRNIPYVLRGGLYDPDSYLRLVRIEAGMKVGHIGSLIARDDSGAGLVLHWSHLLDSLLIACAAPFAPLFGWHSALFWVGAISGPVSVGLLAAAVVWAIAPITERRYRWSAAIAIGVAIDIAGYGQLGVIHHHVLLVLVAVMIAAFALRTVGGFHGAALGAAAWFAFGLWLSPEAWPYGLLGVGTLGVAWLFGQREAARALMVVGGALAVLLVAILAVDPPPGPRIAFDHVSVVHLAMAVMLLALGAGLAGIDRARLGGRSRWAAGAGLAAALIGAWIVGFPRVALGPSGLSATPGLSVMFDEIAELQPLTRPSMIIAMLLPGMFAIVVASWLAWQKRSPIAAYGAFCGLIMLALAFRYVRFAAYVEAAGAAMLPVALAAIGHSEQRAKDVSQAFARVGLLALVLLAPRLALAMDHGLQAQLHAERDGPNCRIRALAARFAPFAGDVVLAHVNDTPELLYRTRVETVGSFYQRGLLGFLRLHAAWRSHPSEQVPAAVRATKAQLILFCPTLWRSFLHGHERDATLVGELAGGRIPPWLHELWRDPRSGNVLYRVETEDVQRLGVSSPNRKSRNTATRFELRNSSG